MTIPYSVQLIASHPEEIEKILIDTFCEVHQIYNNWNPESEISKLNALGPNIRVPISPELENFLKETDKLVAITEGRFDPALGTGWSSLHIENGMFWKDKEVVLDLCAVSKGYAVDLLVDRLKEAGCKDFYVEWGGEIKVSGSHPAGRPWRISILHGTTIELENMAIATSGSYFQQWKEDGKTLTHIIDPRTQTRLNISDQSITSASVIDESCMRADAIATALMLFPSKSLAESWSGNLSIRTYFY